MEEQQSYLDFDGERMSVPIDPTADELGGFVTWMVDNEGERVLEYHECTEECRHREESR